MKNFIIRNKVYPFDIMISVDETDVALLSRLEKHGIADKSEFNKLCLMGDTVFGRTVMFKGNQTLIRLRGNTPGERTHGVIAHEAFHATAYIMNRIGMKFKIGVSDEAYTYLMEYIINEIYKNFKAKKKLNHGSSKSDTAQKTI